MDIFSSFSLHFLWDGEGEMLAIAADAPIHHRRFPFEFHQPPSRFNSIRYQEIGHIVDQETKRNCLAYKLQVNSFN